MPLPARVAAVACGVAVALSSVVTATASAATPDGTGGVEYVALGDSAAAGPWLPRQDLTSPRCLRSDLNYPTLVASRLGSDPFRDVTCSAATTAHLSSPQFRGVAPQYDALTPGTDLVTLHIGANDVGLFPLVLSCINPLPEPVGVSCRDRDTAGGVSRTGTRIDEFAPTYGTVIREIRRRAPHADVLLVGYGLYARPGGCWPRQPFYGKDADYLQGLQNRLNDAARAEAAANGARYVDQQTPDAAEHDSCAAPSQRWFEGVVPGNPAAPGHPTLLGMRHAADVVVASVPDRG